MQNSGKKRVKEPVVDEDELHDWIVDNVDTGGFSHPSVSIDEWYDEEETIPKIITITLSYKTGDGIDQPYSDCPPDEGIIKVFEEHGWDWETEGIMKYGLYCPKCDKNWWADNAEWDEKKLVYLCPRCKTELEEIEGSKWIHGSKKLVLKGNETARQIKNLIKKAINELV
jgi:DNA-directed RNA polymerase subunit RPC12/RpoP